MFSRVTIKDIAQRAGVSTGTVDRILHGRGNVSAKAREKVEKAMGELQYEPNIFASALAYNRTVRIKALLPEYQHDPYWALPKSGIEHAGIAVRHFGVHIETDYYPASEPVKFLEIALGLLDDLPDAFLIAPLFLEESKAILRECAARKIPVALVNTDLEDEPALCYVGQDSYHSGVLAGKLLRLVLQPDDQVAVLNLDKEIVRARHLLEKERGFRDYFLQHPDWKGEILRLDFEGFEHPAYLKAFLEQAFAENPGLRGLFVTNSRSYRVLDAMGPQTPPGLRIVGFDLLPPNLRYLKEERIAFLINQNPVQQGHQAVMAIVDYLIFRKKVERVQYLPLDIVVAENASYYIGV